MQITMTGNRIVLQEPAIYKVDWLNPCEHCQRRHGTEVTSRSLSAEYFYAGDAVKCPECGSQGLIDADGDVAWVDQVTE